MIKNNQNKCLSWYEIEEQRFQNLKTFKLSVNNLKSKINCLKIYPQ